MPTATVSPESFIAICHEEATSYTAQRIGYHASPTQITFFTLAVGRKKHVKQHADDHVRYDVWPTVDTIAAINIAGAVAAHLDGDSGTLVTGLKQENPDEWGALWVQLNGMRGKLIRRYEDQLDQSLQDAVLTETLSKLLAMIRSMPDGSLLDSHLNIFPFALSHLATCGALYNFCKPFPNYAFAILRNEFRRALEKVTAERNHVSALTEEYELPVGVVLEEFDGDEAEVKKSTQRNQLKQLLPQLLAAIETLPRKRRLVAIYTLAGRPQFWLALELAEQHPPADYPTTQPYSTDQQIAVQLEMSDNSVRVNRSHAHRSIVEQDSQLGELFSALTNVHF